MFVSRKNLPFIHFFPSELTSGYHSASEALYQTNKLFGLSALRSVLFQPFAEGCVQRLVLRTCRLPGAFDQVLLGT